jgi:hypothetical protein
MLQTNSPTPWSNGPGIGVGGFWPMTFDGASFIFPALIQFAKASTSFGVGALT